MYIHIFAGSVTLYTYMYSLYSYSAMFSAMYLSVIALFQEEKERGEYYYCLSDFISPKYVEKDDYIGAFAVSAGFGVEDLCEK